jgi:phosphoesterase RecJ-like protein
MQELFIKAGQLIKKSNKILCISHKRPDGDTLGSSNALYHVMRDMGKDVQMACVDDVPERYFFLPEIRKTVKEFNFLDYDLIFVSDAGASYMTKYKEIYPEIFSGKVQVINLDHHSSNDDFGTLNIVDINSASTTILIYKLLTFLGIRISPNVATALLCGIYNDTGSLMHGNTNLEVFDITGKIVELGGKANIVAKNLFKITPVSTMKVWGKVLERATINEEGVVVSVLTQNDLTEANAKSEDITGIVDFLNSVPGSKFTVLLNEDEKGNVKGSFRTRRDDVDLAELAGKFGGGGHKKAAGFTMPGRIHQEVKWRVLPAGASELKETSGKGFKNAQELLGNILQIPEVKLKA